jgi:pimeloyl-ACP methyl ester carboxylesterase
VYVETNGTRLYYEEAGAGQTVVLIHGFTLDTRMWDDQFLTLARHFRVIRYELRGFGRSSLPTEESYSHIEDLRGLLDHLGVAQAALVGLSKGGGVALDFALSYPQHTRALALIDTILGGHAWSDEGSARDALVWQEARRGGIPAAKASWLIHPLFAPAMRQPEVAARLAQIINDYSGWHFVNDNPEQHLPSPAIGQLHTLTMPLLVIVGEYDLPDFRHIAAQIGQHAPDAHSLVVPGAGHMANMEAPEVVNGALLEFLLPT